MQYCVHAIIITLNKGKVRFHWIFAESHHGKGEHDGHGATLKQAFRFFVLGGIYSNITTNFTFFNANNYNVENHFIDNEQEAVDFLNKAGVVLNTTAFLMQVTSHDEEQDCTGVTGSNSMFEFR